MEMIILTGMSGAGKSQAANYLEDMGFFCIDNLPPRLLPELAKSFLKGADPETPGGKLGVNRIAFVVDVRSAELFDGFLPALDEIDRMGIAYRIIYLESTDQALISRYKQTRRNHPLAKEHGLSRAIVLERALLEPIKALSNDVIDTSDFKSGELRDRLYSLLSEPGTENRMTILIQSFGFKYGIPPDCDLVIDVRFIPNPYYNTELRSLSGLDEPVRQFVLQFEEATRFMDLQEQTIEFALPYYIREGKVRLTIGIGCTGGRHRSVALAEDLANRLRDNGMRVLVDHRDIGKDPRQNHTFVL
jgi:UPF0042 nucleotide-binding protein